MSRYTDWSIYMYICMCACVRACVCVCVCVCVWVCVCIFMYLKETRIKVARSGRMFLPYLQKNTNFAPLLSGWLLRHSYVLVTRFKMLGDSMKYMQLFELWNNKNSYITLIENLNAQLLFSIEVWVIAARLICCVCVMDFIMTS
jgi:hypothetical protein